MINSITRKPRAGDPVRDLFNAVFADVANCCGNNNATARIPVDIVEREDEYELRASLPGFQKEDIELEVENGVLSITAHKKDSFGSCEEATSCCEGEMLRQERYAGSVSRSIKLPENIETSSLHARLENGVLAICVTKPNLPEAQRIEIA